METVHAAALLDEPALTSPMRNVITTSQKGRISPSAVLPRDSELENHEEVSPRSPVKRQHDSFDCELLRLESEHPNDLRRESFGLTRGGISSANSSCTSISSLSSYRDSFERDVKRFAKRDGFDRGAASADTPNTSMVKADSRSKQIEAEMAYENEMDQLLESLRAKAKEDSEYSADSEGDSSPSERKRRTKKSASAAPVPPAAVRGNEGGSESALLVSGLKGAMLVCVILCILAFILGTEHQQSL